MQVGPYVGACGILCTRYNTQQETALRCYRQTQRKKARVLGTAAWRKSRSIFNLDKNRSMLLGPRLCAIVSRSERLHM